MIDPISVAHAASRSQELLVRLYERVIDPLFALFIAAGVLVFMWGMLEFIANSQDPEKASDGRRHMLWGIVGLFIIVSAWGIMNFVCETIDACA